MDKFAIRCSDSEPEPLSALQVYLKLHSRREANQPKRSIDPSYNTDKLRNGMLLACLEQIEAPEGDSVPFLNWYKLHLPDETFRQFNHEFRDSDIFVPNRKKRSSGLKNADAKVFPL